MPNDTAASNHSNPGLVTATLFDRVRHRVHGAGTIVGIDIDYHIQFDQDKPGSLRSFQRLLARLFTLE